MRILLFVSLLAIYVSADSLPGWEDMKNEDILLYVLGKDLLERLGGIALENILRTTYKDKWPQGLDWPSGLEQLKNEYAGYSEVEAPWREGRS